MSLDYLGYELKELKATDNSGGGVFSGYASTWEKDLYDDVVVKGAFAQTLSADFKAGGAGIPIHWQHKDGSPNDVIGETGQQRSRRHRPIPVGKRQQRHLQRDPDGRRAGETRPVQAGSIAVSIIDDINASGLPAATRFVRLRASRKPDPYNPAQTTEDWTKPVELEVRGALASSSSTRTPDVLDVQTTSTAVLTVADPNADIRLGDRIRPEPADGRMWEVSGFPSRDANAFTGWQPTLEVQLTEWKG